MLALLAGGLYGAVFGAIPGLTATLAVALFMPLACFLDLALALPAVIAISSVAIYAGDVDSAVARIPGMPASAAYVEELHRLCQGREPVYGLDISAHGSSLGGTLDTAVLVGGATGIPAVATQFSSFEYFWIAILGLVAVAFASDHRSTKALASLVHGMLRTTVSLDPTLGYLRPHFGNPTRTGGLDYMVAMIGLFGFSKVLAHMVRHEWCSEPRLAQQSAARGFFLAPWRLIRRAQVLVARSSLAGIVAGFLPGAGADIGAWISTSLQRMRPRRSDGHIVLAGSSSNNAAVASAWIPPLSLGLQGDTVTAMVLGVFLMKGITPSPALSEQDEALVLTLNVTFLASNVLLFPAFGFLSARMARLTRLRHSNGRYWQTRGLPRQIRCVRSKRRLNPQPRHEYD